MNRLRKRKRSKPAVNDQDSFDVVNNNERNDDEDDNDWEPNIPTTSKIALYIYNCILHDVSLPSSTFIPFNNIKGSVKEKLDNLNKIKGRRLLEPEESPNRLQHVCDLIPETIDDSDADRLGYHRQCYQKFTSNLNSLADNTSSSACEDIHRSPRKQSHSEAQLPKNSHHSRENIRKGRTSCPIRWN